MRILFLKGGRSATQGKEFATLWITTPGPRPSVTLALGNPLCKNVLCSLCHARERRRPERHCSVERNPKALIFQLFYRTKGPQIAYERSFRWKLAHFRYLCQVRLHQVAHDVPGTETAVHCVYSAGACCCLTRHSSSRLLSLSHGHSCCYFKHWWNNSSFLLCANPRALCVALCTCSLSSSSQAH